MNGRSWIGLAAVSGFLCVALGAFGAHALRERLAPRALEIFQTGVHYQMFHSLALLMVGLLVLQCPPSTFNALNTIGGLFTVGILVFSGSLYALAITDIKILGAITPIGGLAFIAGWATLAWSAWKG